MKYLSKKGPALAGFAFVGIQSWNFPIGDNANYGTREFVHTQQVLHVNSPMYHIPRLRRQDTPAVELRREPILVAS